MIGIQIILGLAPALLWFLFYLGEDKKPEPFRPMFLTFISGGAFAFLALGAELILQNIFTNVLALSSIGITAFVAFAFVEEVSKFLAAYFIVSEHPAFDEPVDAMIYTIIAALGFATAENIGVAFSDGLVTGAAQIAGIVQITTIRFMGATLLHTLTAGIIGYWWAVSIRKFGRKSYILWGIVLATALHAAFNLLILQYANMFLIFLLLLIAALFVLADFEKLRNRSI